MRDEDAGAARALSSVRAVRARALQMLELCDEDRLAHWRLTAQDCLTSSTSRSA
ncbi:MAG: hypothetical protein U1E30_02940 [Rhodoblastus sp.]